MLNEISNSVSLVCTATWEELHGDLRIFLKIFGNIFTAATKYYLWIKFHIDFNMFSVIVFKIVIIMQNNVLCLWCIITIWTKAMLPMWVKFLWSMFWETLKVFSVIQVCMEPIFWFVDNFTHLLGPVRFVNTFWLQCTQI